LIDEMSVVSQNVANPLMVSLPNRVQYLPVFIDFSLILLVNNFIKPADIFHSPYTHFGDFLSSYRWKRSYCALSIATRR